MTPWTVAHQAPLTMGFYRQEYWSVLPCPPPGDFPDPTIELASYLCLLHWQAGYLPLAPPGKLRAIPESESHSVMSSSLQPHELCSPWNSPGQNTEVSSLSLLQEIFPTQGLNPGLPYCKKILYQLSHKGSPNKNSVIKNPKIQKSPLDQLV